MDAVAALLPSVRGSRRRTPPIACGCVMQRGNKVCRRARAWGRQGLRCDAMRCKVRQCDKWRYDAIAMRCDAGARWDAMRGRVLGAASAGELGANSGRRGVCAGREARAPLRAA